MSNNVEKSVRMRAQLRENLLLGMLDLPEQIIQLSGAQERHAMETMFSAMWHRFLNNKSSTSTVHWYDQFESDVVFNDFLYHLTHSGWATVKTLPTKNWSEIELNESKLLEFIRTEPKLEQIQDGFLYHGLYFTNEQLIQMFYERINSINNSVGSTERNSN